MKERRKESFGGLQSDSLHSHDDPTWLLRSELHSKEKENAPSLEMALHALGNGINEHVWFMQQSCRVLLCTLWAALLKQRVVKKSVWPQKEKTLLLLSALLLTTSVIFRKSLNSFNPFEPQCAHLNNSNKSVCEEEEEERRVLPWVVPKPSSSFHVYQYYYPPNDSEK